MSHYEKEALIDSEGLPVGPDALEKQEVVPRWKDQPTQSRALLRERLVTLQWILWNIFATVTVVFMNKRYGSVMVEREISLF